MKYIIALALSLCVTATVYPEISNLTNTNPNFPFTGEIYSGFIVVDNATQSNLFYLLYAYNQTTLEADAPLQIWFNGGPGCSSLIGAFGESGPVLVTLQSNGSYSFNRNPNAWNNYAHSLYIDQPVGTGFSVSNGLNISTAQQAAPYINIFLARFYQLYPMLQSRDLYIFGESYAGKYIPYFAQYLLQNQTFREQINIKALGIGDGWAYPVLQTKTWASVMYSVGTIDQKVRDQYNFQSSQMFITSSNGDQWDTTNMSNWIQTEISDDTGGITTLDWRQFGITGESYGGWLNTTEGQSFLQVPPTVYDVCSMEVSDDFFDDITADVNNDAIPYIISQVPTLFYVGQDDLGCDYTGIMNYLNELDWSGIKQWRQTPKQIWHYNNGSVAGQSKSFENLTFVVVYHAGHMVPYYQPVAAAEMVYRFFNGIPFN